MTVTTEAHSFRAKFQDFVLCLCISVNVDSWTESHISVVDEESDHSHNPEQCKSPDQELNYVLCLVGELSSVTFVSEIVSCIL